MMDIRNALIGLIKGTPGLAQSPSVARVLADHLIEHGVTVQGWIPVTERLPEDDLPPGSKKKVLKVIVAYKTSNGVWIVRTQNRQKGLWYGRPEEWDWAKTTDEITHWQRLPGPPPEE